MSVVSEFTVFTDDVEATASFYRRLLGTVPASEWPGGAIFTVGGVTVLVHDRSATLEGGPPNEDHLAVSVEDLETACEALRAEGATVVLEPRDFPWGRSAYLRDPDGRLVELAQRRV